MDTKDEWRADPCLYTRCYCEENVYNILAKQAFSLDLKVSPVLYISNETRSVAIWRQQAGTVPVVWDYHVVLLSQGALGMMVYDLDSTLPFPCPLGEYLHESFGVQARLQPQYKASFRLVPALEYIAWFSSDRSHMRKPDGTWNALPPAYAPICGASARAAGCEHTLPYLWDVLHAHTHMDTREGQVPIPGQVCSSVEALAEAMLQS